MSPLRLAQMTESSISPGEEFPSTLSGKRILPVPKVVPFYQKLEKSVESLLEEVEVSDVKVILANCML